MEFVKVATVGEIAPGTAKRVELGDDEPVAIFNVDGEYYALGDTCSHEEASLAEGDVFGDCVECPLHGSEFDLKTGINQGSDRIRLRAAKLAEKDGNIYVVL